MNKIVLKPLEVKAQRFQMGKIYKRDTGEVYFCAMHRDGFLGLTELKTGHNWTRCDINHVTPESEGMVEWLGTVVIN